MKFLFLACFCASSVCAMDFGDYFLDKTMRVDYFHMGNATEEHLKVDRIVSDGPWHGSKKNLIDPLQYGHYLCELHASDGTVLFTYGFATIFGEWQTTGEARKGYGNFHESLRFPWPKAPVDLVLKKRDAQNKFQPLWRTKIDPKARHVNPTDLVSQYTTHKILDNGPPENKVDLLILGDGYTAGQMEKFHGDAARLTDALFRESPFRERKADFNVYLIDTPSAQEGVSRPHENVYKRSALTTHYSSFDSQRYVLNYDNRKLREIAGAVPYEYMVILVNEKTYGGGGIFRWQATAAADNLLADYLFVHEFGHHFAALADEYYTSSIAYELSEDITVEPWEPNLTALIDPANLKWKDMLTEGIPLPTPWEKEVFEEKSRAVQVKRNAMREAQASESEMNVLFSNQKTYETKLLSGMAWSGKVGAFEGAGYRQKGYYRPEADCLMFTRDDVGFCKVCSRAITGVINFYSR